MPDHRDSMNQTATAVLLPLLAAMLSVGCGGVPAPGPSTTRPVASHGADICEGLAKSLSRPYLKYAKEAWWQSLLTRHTRDFSLAERDRRVSEIGRIVSSAPDKSKLRVAILEQVSGDSYRGNRHQWICLCTHLENAAVPDDIGALHAHKLSREQWDKIERDVEKMAQIGGGNNGLEWAWEYTEATVLSYFDGARWHIETWFFFHNYSASRCPSEPLPGDGHAFFRLLRYIHGQLKDPFCEREYGEEVKWLDLLPEER